MALSPVTLSASKRILIVTSFPNYSETLAYRLGCGESSDLVLSVSTPDEALEMANSRRDIGLIISSDQVNGLFLAEQKPLHIPMILTTLDPEVLRIRTLHPNITILEEPIADFVPAIQTVLAS